MILIFYCLVALKDVDSRQQYIVHNYLLFPSNYDILFCRDSKRCRPQYILYENHILLVPNRGVPFLSVEARVIRSASRFVRIKCARILIRIELLRPNIKLPTSHLWYNFSVLYSQESDGKFVYKIKKYYENLNFFLVKIGSQDTQLFNIHKKIFLSDFESAIFKNLKNY